MSHRPILKKRARRMRKALRPGLPVNIDLVDFLITRKYAQTKGGARRLLVDGRVRSESHILGRREVKLLEDDKVVTKFVADPVVSASYRDTLQVLS